MLKALARWIRTRKWNWLMRKNWQNTVLGIAGEDLEPQDAVYLAEDGKFYQCLAAVDHTEARKYGVTGKQLLAGIKLAAETPPETTVKPFPKFPYKMPWDK